MRLVVPRIEKLSITRRALARGEEIAPVELALAPTDEEVVVSFVVGDPTAAPPTDAKVMLTVEASEDGVRWYPVSHSWGGTSGRMESVVPVRGRRLRVRSRADEPVTISVVAV